MFSSLQASFHTYEWRPKAAWNLKHNHSALDNGGQPCKLFVVNGVKHANMPLQTVILFSVSLCRERLLVKRRRGKGPGQKKNEWEAQCSCWCPQGTLLFLGHFSHTQHTMHHWAGLGNECRYWYIACSARHMQPLPNPLTKIPVSPIGFMRRFSSVQNVRIFYK